MSVTFYPKDASGKVVGPVIDDSYPCQACDAESNRQTVCPWCYGTLVVEYFTNVLELNVANGNAEAMLLAMNMYGDQGLYGECSILQAQQGIAHARSRLKALPAGAVIRPGEEGSNFISFGLDREGLLDRIARFEVCVLKGAALGAVKITWS